jgi:hypothetical protein
MNGLLTWLRTPVAVDRFNFMVAFGGLYALSLFSRMHEARLEFLEAERRARLRREEGIDVEKTTPAPAKD